MADQEKTPGWTIYGEPIRGRSCGACKACCTLVPADLADEHKPSGVRCKHLCRNGCGIYADRPTPCRYWSCKWLFDPLAAMLKRPDVGGYIIAPALDTMLNGGQPFEVAQVWLDPARPDAHRAPELRSFLADIASRFGLAAIIRREFPDMFLLLAPSLTGQQDWIEQPTLVHSHAEMKQHLAAVGARPVMGSPW